MVSHARTAAQRREQRQWAARFAGRLCKMVELRHRGFAPSYALMREGTDFKARAERPRRRPTGAQFRAHHGTDPRRTRPASHETRWDRVWRPHLPSPEGDARPSAPLPHLSVPMQRLSRGSNTCFRHQHLRCTSDRVCGVRACRHRHGACSSVCIRGSGTRRHLRITKYSERIWATPTCRCPCSAYSFE